MSFTAIRSGVGVCFNHIPKTAGSSLSSVLVQLFPAEQVFSYDWTLWEEQTHELVHMPTQDKECISFLYGHMPSGLHRLFLKDFITLVVLRHPMDRLLSHWWHEYPDASVMEFERTVRESYALKTYEDNMKDVAALSNFQTRWLSNALFGEEYANEFAMFESARKYMHECVVGLQEDMTSTLELFSAVLGTPLRIVEDKNVNRSRPRRQDISPEVQSLLRSMNKMDQMLYKLAEHQFKRHFARRVPVQ